MNFMDPESVVDLDNIRAVLIRMEDTVLFDLIERSQFPVNPTTYSQTAFPSLESNFLSWYLRETEKTHSKLRRYDSPDENAFFPQALEKSILPPQIFPEVLAPYQKEINVNTQLLDYYIKEVIPGVCIEGEESQNIGSTAVCDVNLLQSISRRIHFGKFVAESKFRSERSKIEPLIRAQDAKGLDDAITKPAVEKLVLERVGQKAESYGTDPSLRYSEKPGKSKVDPEIIKRIYRDCIIPLTKVVEVDYLLRRLD